MRRLTAFLALALMVLAPAANAQVVLGAVNTGTSSYTTGDTRPLQLNADGSLKVGGAGGAGPVGTAQGASTTGQTETLVACATTASPPTYTTGTSNPLNCTPRGGQRIAYAPSPDAADGLASVRNAAVGSAQVLKAAAGNLYDWQVTSGASAGYVMIFNATTAPADGAVTPAQCVTVAANTTVGSSFNLVPEYYSTGITIVFSTTGCFTKTASATAFIRGRAQ